MLHRITTPLPEDADPKGSGNNIARFIDRFADKCAPLAYWLRKGLYFFYILFSLEFGVMLLFLPWKNFWENNYLLYLYPQVRPIVANAFFKGFVLGLGIANILIGIHEVAQIKHNWKSKHLSN